MPIACSGRPPVLHFSSRRTALTWLLASLGPLVARAALADASITGAHALALRLAAATGLDVGWLDAQLALARYQPEVARLVLPGRPMQKNWHAYRSLFVEPVRINAGARFARAHPDALDAAEQRFGVPRQIVLGILGVETIYGRNMGQFRVLDALATLALAYPPAAPNDRSAFFARQLGDFFRWCRAAGLDPTSVRGSYAGAIGMPQFMPGSILRWGTSRVPQRSADLVNNADDAIASVANFLAAHGWTPGMPTDFPLLIPDNIAPSALARLLAPDIVPSFTAAQLRAAGLPLLPRVLDDRHRLAVVQLPNGDAAPDYILGTRNFFVITRYNHSAFYALAVIELGRAVLDAMDG